MTERTLGEAYDPADPYRYLGGFRIARRPDTV